MSEAEFLGYLVLALITLFTLAKFVVGPLLKAVQELTQTMTTFKDQIAGLQGDFAGMKQEFKENSAHEREAHRRLWDHNDEQDEKISDHDRRIIILEQKEELKGE